MAKQSKSLEALIYVIAGIILIVRIDFWWWGKKIHPIIAGWLTIPMIYQFFLWAVGYALVLIVCFKIWDTEADEKAGGGANK
jgi:hypothetical protein